MSLWTVVLTVLLLAANAFFVGAEFAAMSARRSQLEPLADQGSKGAATALRALRRTGLLLATSQLGITVCSVLLGAISEAALHHAFVPVAERLGLSPVVADVAALALALGIVVFLHVVYGEMIPKNISISRPERSAVLLVPPLVMVSRVVAPVIALMDWFSKAVLRLFGVDPKDEVASAFTAEEVAHILDESRHEGLVADEHYQRLGAALEFSDKDAADVGVPVSALVTVTSAATPVDIERLVAKHGFSRFPVVDDAGTSGGTSTSRTSSTPTSRSGRSPCPPSAYAGWRTCGAVTRSSPCSRRCRTPGPTSPGWSPRTARSPGSCSSRTSSRSSWARSPTRPSADVARSVCEGGDIPLPRRLVRSSMGRGRSEEAAMTTVPARWEVAQRRGWAGATLLGLLLFVAVAAVYGGVGLVVNGLGMPVEWLDRLPVDTWAWPGVALLATVAVPQAVAAWFVWRHDSRAGAVGVLAGLALVLWIVVQLLVLQRYFFLQPVIVVIGLAEAGLAYAWVRRSRMPA